MILLLIFKMILTSIQVENQTFVKFLSYDRVWLYVSAAYLVTLELSLLVLWVISLLNNSKKKKLWKIWGCSVSVAFLLITVEPMFFYHSRISHDSRMDKSQSFLCCSIKGDLYTVPFPIKDLLDNGWEIRNRMTPTTINSGESLILYFGNCRALAVNRTENMIDICELDVVMIEFISEEFSSLKETGYRKNDFIISGGIIPESTELHVKLRFGADDRYHSGCYFHEQPIISEWYGTDTIFQEGEFYITIYYPPSASSSLGIRICSDEIARIESLLKDNTGEMVLFR